jgi:pyruvate dehydrogenase E1 component beta subunit
MPVKTMRQALIDAQAEELSKDSSVMIWGENIEGVGGGFMVTSGLSDEFPGRVKDSPLAETVIAGAAVGAAYCGMRPIVEIMFADFALVCFDEIANKMAKMRYGYGAYDDIKLPIVVRMKTGGYATLGMEHSQTPTGYFMHTPGIKIAYPTTPYDAKGLLKTAVKDNNPVVFLEHIFHYGVKGDVPEEEYFVPFGEANIRREGKDVTVVAIGYMVDLALEAATKLEGEGVDVEVIDPRTIEPLDMDTIMSSLEKTGKVVVVDEDVLRCGVTGEILIQVYERLVDAGKSPVPMVRVAAANVPIPYSPALEKEVLPSAESIVDGIQKVLNLS